MGWSILSVLFKALANMHVRHVRVYCLINNILFNYEYEIINELINMRSVEDSTKIGRRGPAEYVILYRIEEDQHK